MIKKSTVYFHTFSIIYFVFVFVIPVKTFGTDIPLLEKQLKYYETVEKNKDSADAILWRLYLANSLSYPKKSLGYLNQLELLREKGNQKIKLGDVYTEKGKLYVSMRLFNLAVNYYLKAYQIYLTNDEMKNHPYFLIELGNVYWSMGIYDISEKYYRIALDIFISSQNSYGQAVVLNNLGLISQARKDFPGALEYFNSALELRKKLSRPFLIAHSYGYIGNLHLEMNNKDLALKYLLDAYDIMATDSASVDPVDKDMFSSLNSSVSGIYQSLNDYPKAMFYARKAIDENERHNKMPGLRASLYLNVSYLYYLQNRIDSAIFYAEISSKTAAESNDLSMQKVIFRFLAHLYSKNNDPVKSNWFFEKTDMITDSITAIDDKARNEQLRLVMETYDQEIEISVLQEKNKKSNFIIYGISFTTLLVIAFLISIISYRRKITQNIRELANSTFEGLFIHDNGVIIEVNQKLIEMTGYSREEMIGSSVFRFFENLDEGKVRQITENEEKEEFEALLKSTRGDRVHVEVLSRPMEFGSKKRRVAAVRDITQRLVSERLIRISEANLQALINNTNDVIWSLDNEFKIISCNLNFQCMFEALTGVRPVKGDNFFEVLPKSLSPVFQDMVSRIPDTGRMHEEMELDFGNIRRSFDVSLYKITLGGESTGVSVFMHDLTEKHRLMEQLKESNITKDKFFNIIAHDLKNPFNVILGFSDILISDFESLSEKDKLEFIKNIREASANTYDLLENLLNWSRLQIGRFGYRPELHELLPLVNEVLTYLKVQADAKKITLTCSIEPGTTALFDKNMVSTILRNLISNAIKFTQPSGTVSITTSQQLADNETMLKVSVTDTGIGISQDNIDKILKADHYFNTPGTGKEKGTGLGLLLCHDFLKLHNSRITIESNEGLGSTFSFILKMKT